MELTAGYKRTEVGVIPDGWDVSALQGICAESITYGIVQCGPHLENGVPYIRVSDMNASELDVTSMLRTSPALAAQFSRSTVREGDIVYALRGKIGEVRQIDASVSGANLTQGTARLSPSSAVDSTYLLWTLRSQSSLRQGDLAAKGSTFREITLESLRHIQLPVPPIPEQSAIAAALSDVDTLLTKLGQIITKKRDLKQAAMQQLLTGQTRLPGFDTDWEVMQLGAVGRFLKGSGVKKDESSSGDLRCIRYGEIYTQHNDYIKSFHSWISPEVAATALRLKKGDLCFAGSGETKEEIGKCVAFVDEVEAYAGGDIVILRPEKSNSVFLGYYLNTNPVNRQKASRGQGDAVVHISATALSAVQIVVPKLAEQTAIAAVLSDMDTEIAALEARREKTRALKQGMMQELLTGRIRLI